ncbi:Uncharacterised protein [Nocardia brasiliensis]|nr:Uncharacterised protein [Nocardia brasiliensis]
MPPHPISTLMTLVIPLFFVLGVVSAPPGTAGPLSTSATTALAGMPWPPDEVGRKCSGSACELRRLAPRAVDEGFGGNLPAGPAGPAWCASLGPITVIPTPAADCAANGSDPFERTPLDREYCEYVGPAPFFLSPSDSEFCGFVSPAPLSVPSVGAGRPAG